MLEKRGIPGWAVEACPPNERTPRTLGLPWAQAVLKRELSRPGPGSLASQRPWIRAERPRGRSDAAEGAIRFQGAAFSAS